ncbi:protein arginine methyltransferase NDUFAF7 homolog, mitochondrial-like [Brassica napus]|uniref:Protein arginine methyltransferase NDUFAF7 n=1 Tax=Brassica napus TaxID=3708 RepID=A0A816UR94_BRANA|nr:protein arginine methyltransferase NDUFAF7 homolog, mitochondrial-like [Brassica napus]CAF2112090.1 unnamed protein product [Brassica napus]
MSGFPHAGVSKIGVGSITCYRQIRRLRSCPAALNGGSETETNSETLASRMCSSLQSSFRSENHKLSHSQDGGEEAGPTRNKRERTTIPHRRSVDTISLPDNQTSPTNPALQKRQHQNLKCTDESSSEKKAISSLAGTPVHWHATLEEVPSGVTTIIIAHEFYDAFPIHQFQPTPAALYLVKRCTWATPEEKEKLDHVEISPKLMDLTQEITKIIGSDGGGALIIDYGNDGIISDSLQAIREHKFVNILNNPGSADLSAYVDFPSIKHSAEEASENVTVHGPMTQSQFLGSLGINFRVDALLQNCDDEQAESLRSGYWRLVGDGEAPFWEGPDEQTPIGMGERYLTMAIINRNQGTPAPFQ